MLSEKLLKLLTGFVDGELDSRQRKTVLKLLRKSPRARKLYNLFKEDSKRLSNLSETFLPNEFPVKVMQEIRQLGVPGTNNPNVATSSPTETRPNPQPCPASSKFNFPTWMLVSLAACLFVAVTAVSYLFFKNLGDQQVVEAVPLQEKAPLVEKVPSQENVPLPDLKPIEKKDRLRLTLKDLRKKPHREQLAKELRKETAFQVKLICHDKSQALDRLEKVFRQNSMKILVNPDDRKKFKKATQVVLLAEDVMPYELSTILHQLGTEKNLANSTIHTFALNPLEQEQREEIAKTMGIDSNILKPAGKAGKAQHKKPILDRPIIPVPGPGPKKAKPTPKKKPNPKKPAVLLVMDSDSRAVPSQIQEYLNSRTPQPTPGNLQVVFIFEEMA